ncbi:hypothetical protein ACTFR8_22545 [Bacillus cereus group sp. MYBK15-3]|uniref:hypothetical protein n=1 Tax=unclassified Bacillus cereus group TaxID=2750818 RepID=UPI003F7A2585
MTRKHDYKLIGFLYKAGYSQGAIADVFGSVSGHISKVLKKEGVPSRPRGQKVVPVPCEKFPAPVRKAIEEAGLATRVKKVSDACKQPGKKPTVGVPKQQPKVSPKDVTKGKETEKKKEDKKQKDVNKEGKGVKKGKADVSEIAKKLLDNWIENTDLKYIKLNPIQVGAAGTGGVKVSTGAGWDETRKRFLWIDERNIFNYHNYDELYRQADVGAEFDAETAMLTLYDGDEAVDPKFCKTMRGILNYGKKLNDAVSKKNPTYSFDFIAEGVDGNLYVDVIVNEKAK